MNKLNSILIAVTVTILMSLFADTASAQTIELRNGATISNVERSSHYVMKSSTGESQRRRYEDTVSKDVNMKSDSNIDIIKMLGINWSWISMMFSPDLQYKMNVLKPTRKAYMTSKSK